MLRDKTKRRLRWFVVIFATVCSLAAIGYLLRNRHLESVARSGRAEGLRLLESKDYYHAMHKIGPFVRRHPDDVETLFAYAQAREQVPEPENKHLTEALSLLRRVRSLNPNHQGAADALMELYQRVGFDSELLQLSTDVLARNPKYPLALHGQALALYRLRRFEDALKSSMTYNQALPQDVDAHCLTFEILRRCDRGTERLLKRAEELRAGCPGDVRFAVLQSIAFSLTENQKAAREWIERVPDSQMPDVRTSFLLVSQCRALGLYERALAVLERESAKTHDPTLSMELASRLWQLGRYQQLLDRFPSADANESPQILAIRCMALYRLGKPEAADALARLRGSAEATSFAQVWASVIEPVFRIGKPDDPSIVRACQAAIKEQPQNPYFHFFLGEAYQRIGETEAAIRAWRQAASVAPAWGTPMIRLAQAMLRAGQVAAASQCAQAALEMSADDIEAIVIDLSARAAALEFGYSQAATDLLKRMDAIHVAHPEEGRIIPVRVLTLIRSGRIDETGEVIRASLQAQPVPSAPVLLQLASMSRQAKLGVETECLDVCERTYGTSPDLAFARAREALESGHADQGLALLEQARSAIRPGAPDELEWEIAWARYLDLSKDPRCKQAWMSLADRYSDNPRLQWLALSIQDIQPEREFVGKVLDRLRDQFGNQGLTWRLARARWLLDQSAPEKDRVEAARLLGEITRSAPDMLAPRLLLADCLVKLGSTSAAIEQLTTAANLQPDSAEIALALGRLLHQQNDFGRSRVYLDRVLNNASAEPQQKHDAAECIAAQGDTARALQILEKLIEASDHAIAPDLLLAKLYRQTGQVAKLDSVCNQLLATEKADPQTLAFVAEFYASRTREAEADAVLKRLDALDAAPGVKEIIRGEHALRLGKLDDAMGYFTAATRVVPDNALAWRQLIRSQLAKGSRDEALATARAAQARIPSDAGLQAFIRQAPAALAVAAQVPEVVELIADLLTTSDSEQAVASLVQVFVRAKAGEARPLAQKLRTLAEGNPRLLPLQLLAARICTVAGQPEDAATLASRAMQAFPNNSAAAAVAARAFAACGRWPEALSAAQQWRARSPDDRLSPDQLIAASQMQLGNPDAAKRQLDPYLDRALADPDANGLLLLELAQIQVQMGKVSEAADLLRPMMQKSNQGRLNWMLIASNSLRDNREATKWLQEADAEIPADELAARVALATAWCTLARRSQDANHQDSARKFVLALVPQCQEQATPEQLVALGSLCEIQKDLVSAEGCYRSALAKNPSLPVAQNNLAMIFALPGERLDEALALATQATKSKDPNLPSFYDTLAFVHAQRHEYEAAIEAIQTALHLQPADPRFQIRFATLLVDNHEVDRARAIVDQMEALPNLKDSAPDIFEQLPSLRERIREAKSSSAKAS